jgi:hypothetical protein
MEQMLICTCEQFLFHAGSGVQCPHCGALPQLQLQNYVFYSPLIPSLQLYWKNFPAWADMCYHPWLGHESLSDIASDIYDSDVWNKHPELADADGNMGFVLFLDGVNVYQCGNYTGYPVFLMNANLSPKER